MFASSYPLLDIFWWMLEFFALVIFFYLLFVVFGDIFRSRDMGGFAKAMWVIFVIFIPLIGILVYLIARGGSMHERSVQQAKRQQEAFDSYVRETAGAGGTSSADEIAKLADLKAKGTLTEDEFQAGKARILGGS